MERSYICTKKDQEDIKYAQDALYILHGKWRMPIVIVMYNGVNRYREIARNIPGITFAMLSKELQFMELNNLVERKVDPDFPKTVEYRLTPYAETLYPVVQVLVKWGKEHRENLKRSS